MGACHLLGIGETKGTLHPRLVVVAEESQEDSSVGGDCHECILAAGQPHRILTDLVEDTGGSPQVPVGQAQAASLQHAYSHKPVGGEPYIKAVLPLSPAQQVFSNTEG